MSSANETKNASNRYAEEAQDTFCEEKGGPLPGSITNPSKVTVEGLTQRKPKLSICSRNYDVNGDGKLDDVEQAMRDMDSREMGHLSNDKVYEILQQQMKTQQELFNMKRLVFGFAGFALILALSNLGTAFAAARLAKDTQVTSDGILVNKNDASQVVGIHVESKVFDLTSADERRLDLVDGDSTAGTSGDSISFSDAEALYARCDPSVTSAATYIRHSCGDVTETIQICGPGVSGSIKEKATGPQPKSYTWTYRDGDVEIGACRSSDSACPVAFANALFECGNPVTPSPVSPAPTPAPTPSPVEVFITPAPIATRPPISPAPVTTPTPAPTPSPVEVFITPAPVATRLPI